MNKYYTVTALLKFPACGHTGYTTKVVAKTKAEAIKKARPMVRNSGWDRHEGPLKYSAEVED